MSLYGIDKKEVQKQRWRDLLKSAIIKSSEYGIFVLMGIENQSDIHYAMPVRNMMYDAIRYAHQVDEIAKINRKLLKEKMGKATGRSSDEYLSGFGKDQPRLC